MSDQLTSAAWQQACELFETALEQDAAVRDGWLLQQPADPAVLRMVQQMLQADAQGLQEPPSAPTAFAAQLEGGWPEGMLLGPWRIERRLGQGGMGEVYLAARCDGTVQQQVAIKRLRGHLAGAELKARFLAERRILASLVHPHIARFVDAGSTTEGQPYAVMEYVDGEPITAYAERLQLDTAARLQLFLKVADAVDHAHRQLVVHRDIKPGNVLVDAEGNPRLLDFGIARVLETGAGDDTGSAAPATETGLRAFSLPHAAPEQLRGEPTGVACDVYALGVLLYQLLTGRLPLETAGLSYGEAERRVLEWMPPTPSRIAPGRGLRGDLDRILLHALRKDPAERYVSVAALRADVQRHLLRKPISLRRHHRWYALRLLLRRHPWPIGLAAGLVLSVLVGGALLYRQVLITTAQRDQARAAMGLIQSAFRASNPLEISGVDLSLQHFVAAALPELEQRFASQPRLYAELAATLADVELSSGRAAEARALAERARAAWARAPQDAALGAALRLLEARAALASSDYAAVEQALAMAHGEGEAQQLEWQLLQARLHSHRGEYIAAAALLEALLQQWQQLGPTDERAGELRRQAAQAQRFLGNEAAALALIEQTIAWQQRELPHDHPRITLSRLYRLGPLAAEAGADAALQDSERLLADIERSFGSDSTVYAAALSSIANTLTRADRLPEAAVICARALESWRRAAGEQHQNTLRTLFNLAQLRAALDPQDASVEALFREAVEHGESTLGRQRHTVLFWRLSWAAHELKRGRLDVASALMQARREELLHPAGQRVLEAWLEQAEQARENQCGDRAARPECIDLANSLGAWRTALAAATAAPEATRSSPPAEPASTQE